MGRDALLTARTYRQILLDMIVGARQRSTTVAALIDALVTKGALTAITSTTFGFFSSPVGNNNCAITALGTTLTSADNPFSAGMVGQAIDVQGAGVAGATLRTTVASYNSAGSVELTDAASTTVAPSSTSAGGIAVWGDTHDFTMQVSRELSADGTQELTVAVVAAAAISGFLLSANNLSDLANVGTARNNMHSQTTTTGDITLTVASDLVLIDTAAGNVTVTLPAGPSNGQKYRIKKVAAANTATIARNGKNIEGVAQDIVMKAFGHCVDLEYQSDYGWQNVNRGGLRVTSFADATPVAPNADITDIVDIPAQSQAFTLSNFTGAPNDGDVKLVRLKTAAVRVPTFGNKYRFGTDATQPAGSSGGGLTDYWFFIYNKTDDKWDFLPPSKGY